MLEMFGNLSPTFIAMPIFDYTEHMSAGGKKNATFIMEQL